MKWYELSEEQRIKEVFSKHTIKNFWDWWTNGKDKTMEVRIMDFNLIKEIGNKYKLPYSSSGVYVDSAEKLKTVIAIVREKATCWFGINSRKKNWNKRGHFYFGGTDHNIEAIEYLFIDIDRVEKNGSATKEQLKNCDILAEKILERLGTEGWNKRHIKICSGNGVQLFIALDVPIKIPTVQFKKMTNQFEIDEGFDQMKKLLAKGIGQKLISFCRKYRDELKVEIDKSCFLIGKVGALTTTKNYKYGGYTWRGIIETTNGENTGLSDYIYSKIDDIKQFKEKNVFSSKRTSGKDRVKTVEQLRNHLVVKFMLENDLPYGQINNYVWFQIKCLIRDGIIDMNGMKFRKLHKELETKYGTLTLNLPDKQFSFSKDIINRYCINNCIPPVYELWEDLKTSRNKISDRCYKWSILKPTYKLSEEKDILDDLKEGKVRLLEKEIKNGNWERWEPHNTTVIGQFIGACIEKYGEKKTKYYFDYLMKRYFFHD